MNQPLVSFIIPVLNGDKDIARCLLSIQNQKGSPKEEYEVLVVDNGSTDRTHQIVGDLGFNIEVIPQVSVAALRNYGAKVARGNYLAFVDADVELSPDWLESGLASFKDQRVLASGGRRGIPHQATWVQRAWGLHLESRRPKDQPKSVPWLYSMAFIVRRNEFLTSGGFAEYLETAEDVDLCYRLGQRGTILYNPAMEAVHWGEDPDLATFWNKEVWRGRGSLKGVLGHGLRWDELPSLGYPSYMLCGLLFFLLGSLVDLWHRQLFLVPLSVTLLVLPALGLALNTVRLAKKPALTLKLFLLYFIYGLARAYAAVKP